MLDDEKARQLAEAVTSGLKTINDSDPKATWTYIFTELFKSIRQNGVVEVDQLQSIVVAPGSPLSAGPTPVAGTVLPPSTVSLKGKIT